MIALTMVSETRRRSSFRVLLGCGRAGALSGQRPPGHACPHETKDELL